MVGEGRYGYSRCVARMCRRDVAIAGVELIVWNVALSYR